MLNRRTWLAGAGAAGLMNATPSSAAPAVVGASDTSVKGVEQIFVDVPFKPVPGKHQYREYDHEQRRFHHFLKVTLANGVVGIGDGGARPGAVERVAGRKAPDLMWDDGLGAGLQMALFDAVARTNDVPVHRLLGRQVRDRAFLSWWAVDMPAADWIAECKEAVSLGYTCLKGKARPWFDLIEQCRQLVPTIPKHFKIDFDFNAMLMNSGEAAPYLVELEQFANIDIFESPIPQSDVEGNKLLRKTTRIPIAMHYGTPPIMTALREEVCDGFVVGGGASRVMEQGALLASANKPFWLQLTGTGLMTTWAIHLAAVLTHARWPAINLNHMHVSDMIKPVIQLSNGTAPVPEGPGLGVSLDEDAVARFRIDKIPVRPRPNKLYAIRWPSGSTSYYRNADEFRADFVKGLLPAFPRGVYMEEVPDNGSRDWKDMHGRAQKGGVHVGGRPL
jgi:L-alanine-DL-glutamate epimerase-like enolase superfamily enzyme